MEGYGSRAVAAITGLSQRQIDYWDRTHFIKPSLAMSSGKGTRRLYDFIDLIQFRVAASLREKGISLQKIRKCVKYLRQNRERLERPLASLKFLTDGDLGRISGALSMKEKEGWGKETRQALREILDRCRDSVGPMNVQGEGERNRLRFRGYDSPQGMENLRR